MIITKYRYTQNNQRIESLTQPEGIEFEKINEEVIEEKIFNRVKPIQFRIALLQKGVLSTILTELEKPENETYKIAFEYALEFGRHDNMIVAFGQVLNLSSNQIDEIFETAQNINV